MNASTAQWRERALGSPQWALYPTLYRTIQYQFTEKTSAAVLSIQHAKIAQGPPRATPSAGGERSVSADAARGPHGCAASHPSWSCPASVARRRARPPQPAAAMDGEREGKGGLRPRAIPPARSTSARQSSRPPSSRPPALEAPGGAPPPFPGRRRSLRAAALELGHGRPAMDPPHHGRLDPLAA